jgi:hypothetical protein
MINGKSVSGTEHGEVNADMVIRIVLLVRALKGNGTKRIYIYRHRYMRGAY